jgi:mannose-6-phosphate isomerase-like protein (cupin superfamily)
MKSPGKDPMPTHEDNAEIARYWTMSRPGDALEIPVTGERLIFRRRAADSGGAVLSFEYFLPAGGSVQLAHVHPRQEERFEIVSGRAKIRVGRRLLRATAGESVVVPRGTVHRLWNDGDDELHVVVEFRPALRTEQGFEQLFGLGRDGKLSARGFPHPLQTAVMAKEYRDEGQFPFLPAVVQRALIAPLATIGERLGYRANDPRYRTGPRTERSDDPSRWPPSQRGAQ